MNSNLKTVIGIIVFIAFLIFSYFAYMTLINKYHGGMTLQDNISSQNNLKQVAPDFTVFNEQGKEVKLSDFIGKPIVLNFWASWCPPCKGEMPHFDEVYSMQNDEVVFMMVDLIDGQRETQEKGQQYVSAQDYKLPIYFDNQQQAADAYGITSIPTTLFIDKEGNIVTGYQGGIDKKTLLDGIELIKK